MPELEQLGFGVVAFACTTCNGMSGALDPAIQKEVVERDLYATAVLSGNRNFDGRIHPYAKQAFLASPPLVVAYAIAGTIRFDIEKDVLGIDARRQAGDAEGHLAVRRGDRRDRRVERQARAVPQGVRPDVRAQRRQRRARSARCTTGGRMTTYIRRPPYWEGALAGERPLQGMRPLAVLGDNITTDHLSPSNAIMARQRRRRIPGEDGPAGGRLQLLRHPSRRPPDRAARDLRQPDPEERDGDGRRQGQGRLAGPRRAGRPVSCACGKPSRPTWSASSR